MRLTGKSRAEIERALEGKSRGELLEIIYTLVVVEEHFTPAAIARRSKLSKRTVLADAHAGKFGGEFFKRTDNQLRLSASGVKAWRDSMRVKVNGSV